MPHASTYLAAATLLACACERHPSAKPDDPRTLDAYAVRAAPDTPKPPFIFSPDDEKFLDEVQRGAFNFLWHAGEKSATGMVPDRTSKPTVSVAGVGFQLSGICIAVERGWITRAEGEARARSILTALAANPANRKAGLFYHFIHHDTAGQPTEAYEHVVSTIDSALLFAGIITASQYFGGDVAATGDALFAAADWTFFTAGVKPDPVAAGFVTLGWKPDDKADPTGAGALLPYAWIDSGDEHKLVTFLAVCAPDEAHRLDPAIYYRLRRQLGEYGDSGHFSWFPWSGALFTSFFAHCWINYAAIGPDDPAAFNMTQRVSIDWWENARRTALMHRQKAIENPENIPWFGENFWGLTASDVHDGYAVPGLFPRPILIPGAIANRDYAVATVKDNYGDGTLAPYGAGSCIMFLPTEAVAALRHYRDFGPEHAVLWSDPATGGYGLADAFNHGTGWVGNDHLAIDQGPLLLAIENARTGRVWKTFHAHPAIKAGMDRLKLSLGTPTLRVGSPTRPSKGRP